MLFSKVRLYRYILFVFLLALWSAAAIFGLRLNSIIDLIHFLSIPIILSYFLIFRPVIVTKNILSYCIFLAIVTAAIAGYLIAFTQTIPFIRINWLELPIAVYFLMSAYVILWLADKLICRVVSAVLRINGEKTKSVIRGTLRTAFLIFIGIPYLVAIFTTHWLKFANADNPKKLMDMEYRRVCFSAQDGAKLDGWFIPSAISMSDSAVIIAGGRSPSKNLFLSYAKVFSDCGYNVLLFDLRGNGSSSGHKYSFGINEAGDILSAVDYLESKERPSSKYIFGLGINEGASALITAAAGRDESFAGLALDSVSGYDIYMPDLLADCLPGWMQKALLKVTRGVIAIDIGQPVWGRKKLYSDISQISPCPVLIANSLRTDTLNRRETIELYTKAKEPKMLVLTPPLMDEGQMLEHKKDYFKNILEMFAYCRAKQQPGYWLNRSSN